MAHELDLVGLVASRAGFFAAGRVAWRRRCRTSPWARGFRYIADVNARQTPSSGSLACTVVGAASTWSSLCNIANTSLRSTSLSARGCGRYIGILGNADTATMSLTDQW
jgi:hypothetical protein